MVFLKTTYELCFGETYFEYFESCDFSRENVIEERKNLHKKENVYWNMNISTIHTY
jgi:hypothetical protein